MPGAVRIPRQMLVLRQDALSRSHTKLVAYDSTDARSMQARTQLCYAIETFTPTLPLVCLAICRSSPYHPDRNHSALMLP